jgi:putative DNA primase/helicase
MTDKRLDCIDDKAIRLVKTLDGGLLRDSFAKASCPTHRDARPDHLKRDHNYTRLASAIWNRARPLAGTLGEKYLRSLRIDFNPPELRFVYRCVSGSGTAQTYHPAIIAAVRDSDGLTAIYRMFLRSSGLGLAKISNPKLMLGLPIGGVGQWGNHPYDTLRLADDIEDAASAMIVKTHGTPIWPVFGIERYAHIYIPQNIRRIIIYAQPGKAALDTIARVSPQLTECNRILEVEQPPGEVSWNDYLQWIRR